MPYKRITTLAITFVLSFTAVLLTFYLSTGVSKAHASPFDVSEESNRCGVQTGGVATCTLILPAPSVNSPTSTVIVTSATQITKTIIARIDVDGVGVKLPNPIYTNTILVEIGNIPLLFDDVTGTLLSPTSLLITATNVPLSAPETVVTFTVNDTLQDFEAIFKFEMTTTHKLHIPIVLSETVKCAVDNGTDCGEPNNTIETAYWGVRMNPPIFATAHLTSDQRDYYGFNVLSDVTYTVEVSRLVGTGDLDLYIYDSTKTLRCQSNITGVSIEVVKINSPSCPLPAGKYFALVYVFKDAAASLNRYRFSIGQP